MPLYAAGVWLAALTSALLACTGSGPATVEEAGATAGAIDLQGDAAKPKAPSDAAGFIALLWPLPSPQLHVTYELKGPGGLEGTLDLRLRQDASRREDWALQVPVPDAEPIEVKGTTTGSVWGTEVYTSDTHLGAAAVHQGLLKPGERDVLKVKVIAGQNEYLGTTKNGVTSQSYGAWSVSFVIGKAAPARTDPAPEPSK
jgi:hypothetical protein